MGTEVFLTLKNKAAHLSLVTMQSVTERKKIKKNEVLHMQKQVSSHSKSEWGIGSQFHNVFFQIKLVNMGGRG